MQREQAELEKENIEYAEFLEGIKNGESVFQYLPKTTVRQSKDIEPKLTAAIRLQQLLTEQTAQVEIAIRDLQKDYQNSLEYEASQVDKIKARREANKDADYDFENDRDNAIL